MLKFTLSNTWFQSLRCLALKVTILQAFKVKPFCHQKWYLNCTVKIPRDNNLWRHFGAKIVLTIVDRKEKRKPQGRYCVAGAPNQQNCQNTTFPLGIRMYQFPSDQAVRVKWVQVVQRRIQYQNTLCYVRRSLKSRPMSEACQFWVAWPSLSLSSGPTWRRTVLFFSHGHVIVVMCYARQPFDRTIECHFRWCIGDLSAATKLARTN